MKKGRNQLLILLGFLVATSGGYALASTVSDWAGHQDVLAISKSVTMLDQQLSVNKAAVKTAEEETSTTKTALATAQFDYRNVLENLVEEKAKVVRQDEQLGMLEKDVLRFQDQLSYQTDLLRLKEQRLTDYLGQLNEANRANVDKTSQAQELIMSLEAIISEMELDYQLKETQVNNLKAELEASHQKESQQLLEQEELKNQLLMQQATLESALIEIERLQNEKVSPVEPTER